MSFVDSENFAGLVYSKDIEGGENVDNIKETMLLFLQEFIITSDIEIKFTDILDKIFANSSSETLNILDFRISIDSLGNSSLHWLSKLSLVEVIKDIFANKSDSILVNDKIVNNCCESCLVECIKSINSFNSNNFKELLAIFNDIVCSNDLINHRNILQHICLNYNKHASEYYMKEILEYVSTNYSAEELHNFINNKDIEGDTCLNIASKLNLHSLIQILLETGADPLIENGKFIKPVDYGVSLSNDSTTSKDQNFTTPIRLINDTIADINTTYMKEAASYTAKIKNLESEIAMKKGELSKLKENVEKVNLKDYDSLKHFNFLNNGLVKQKELLDQQLDTFPELKQFINTLDYEGKIPIPLLSEELLTLVDESNINSGESNDNTDNSHILSNLNNKLTRELESISMDKLDMLIETYKQQNESMKNLYVELGDHKRRRIDKYRTLIAKSLDMDVEDKERIDVLVEGICNEM